MPAAHTLDERLSTGVAGLDDILQGGLPAGHLYLIEGNPGSGKTTFGLQFLLAGVAAGEHTLYITLAESRAELEQAASSHGFELANVEVFEVEPPELAGKAVEQYTVFHPSEVELADVMQSILDQVARVKATRIVIDSMSELRMLARDPLRYRRQIMMLKQFFMGQNTTVLLLDDRSGEGSDTQLQSIAHGVLRMETLQRNFGTVRRQMEVRKMRASAFREGFHDYIIRKGGLVIFPRLISAEHREQKVDLRQISSGIDQLDRLMGGGLSRGTGSLFLGPAGCGKSTLATRFLVSSAERGERGVMFIFDELPQSVLTRSEGLGIPLEQHISKELVSLQQLDPAQISPGEFVSRIRSEIEEKNCRMVCIDSLNGLFNAMQEEAAVVVQLHELLTFLNQRGVLTIMVMAQYGLMGSSMSTPLDVSYLADNVLLFRYFEAHGAIRQAISVMKRRSGPHERTIRELVIAENRISVGGPLKEFEGILTGTPRFVGGAKDLWKDE